MLSMRDKQLIDMVTNFDTRGAYTVRRNASTIEIHPTNDVEIIKTDSSLVFNVAPNKENLVLSVPAIITESNVEDHVHNIFNVGDNTSILIAAGCAIENEDGVSMHEGKHEINLGKNAHVKYVEQHIGMGKGHSNMNTFTIVKAEEGSTFEMDTTQIEGINNALRDTSIDLDDNAHVDVKERIMTFGSERAATSFKINLNGEDSKANITSRSVAVNNSYQSFESDAVGNNKCYCRVECDGIIKDSGRIDANPKVKAIHNESELTHEAAIGRVAGEQLMKLMTLGLNKDEAELEIINGFLR